MSLLKGIYRRVSLVVEDFSAHTRGVYNSVKRMRGDAAREYAEAKGIMEKFSGFETEIKELEGEVAERGGIIQQQNKALYDQRKEISGLKRDMQRLIENEAFTLAENYWNAQDVRLRRKEMMIFIGPDETILGQSASSRVVYGNLRGKHYSEVICGTESDRKRVFDFFRNSSVRYKPARGLVRTEVKGQKRYADMEGRVHTMKEEVSGKNSVFGITIRIHGLRVRRRLLEWAVGKRCIQDEVDMDIRRDKRAEEIAWAVRQGRYYD